MLLPYSFSCCVIAVLLCSCSLELMEYLTVTRTYWLYNNQPIKHLLLHCSKFVQARFPELMEDFEGDVDRVAARVAWDYMQVNLGCQFRFHLHCRV
jgi:hypothetical protein